MPRRRSGGKRKAPQPSRKANDSVLSQRVTFRHSGTVAVYDEHEGVPLRPREAVAHPAAGADDEDDEDEEEEEDGDERSEGEGLYDDGPIEGFGTARNMQTDDRAIQAFYTHKNDNTCLISFDWEEASPKTTPAFRNSLALKFLNEEIKPLPGVRYLDWASSYNGGEAELPVNVGRQRWKEIAEDMAQEAFAPATWSTSMGGDMSSIRVYYRSPKDEKVGGAVVWRSRGWTITPELFYCRRLPVTERHYFMQARMMDAMPGRSGDAKSKDGPSQAKHVTFEGFAGGLVASRSWHDGEQTLEDDVNEDDEESERLRKLAKDLGEDEM